MNGMQCTDCGATHYSAAAKAMVERGDRCPDCGGELVFREAADLPIADQVAIGGESCEETLRRIEAGRRGGRLDSS